MKISVIVPAYNCADYLARCLESLQRQSLASLEILVCDDCSTDGTREIIKDAAARDARIRPLSTNRHCGAPAIPRNIGLAHANGEYIGFVDADDWVDHEMFGALLAEAATDKPDIVSASFFHLHEGDTVIQKEIGYGAINGDQPNPETAFQGHFSHVLHRIYRTDFLRHHRITFPFLSISEDYCFSAACHLFATRTRAASGGWYHYNRNRAGSTTQQRQGALGLDNINFFGDGIRYFEQLGLWSEHGHLIFKHFLPSLTYTYSRLQDEYRRIFRLLFHSELERRAAILDKTEFSAHQLGILQDLGVRIIPGKRPEFIAEEEGASPLLPKANNLFTLGDHANAIRLYRICLEKYPSLASSIRPNISRAHALVARSHPRWSWQATSAGAAIPPDPPSPSSLPCYDTWPSPGKFFHGGRRLGGPRPAAIADGPLVTIVTTVRNAADHIGRCIQSVFTQSYPNIEYVVVDAASSDGTLEVIRQHEQEIDYILSEADEGIYCGLNKGLQLATGEYIIILNADDQLEHDGVQALVTAALASDADLVFGSAKIVGKHNAAVGVRPSRWDASLLIRCPARHGAMLARRSAYEQVGLYDSSLRIIADMVWMQRAHDLGLRVEIIDHTVFTFRQGGVSSPDNPLHQEELMAHLVQRLPDVDRNVLRSLVRAIRLTEEQITAIAHAYLHHTRLLEALAPLMPEPSLPTKPPARHA